MRKHDGSISKNDQLTHLSLSKCQDMMPAHAIMCFNMICEHLNVFQTAYHACFKIRVSMRKHDGSTSKSDQLTHLSVSKCQVMMPAPAIMCFSIIREHLDVLPDCLPCFFQNEGKHEEA